MKTLLLILLVFSVSLFAQELDLSAPEFDELRFREGIDESRLSILDYNPLPLSGGSMGLNLTPEDIAINPDNRRNEFGLTNRDVDFLVSHSERTGSQTSSCSREVEDRDGLNLGDQGYTIQGDNGRNTRIGMNGADRFEIVRDWGCASGIGRSRVSATSRFGVDVSGNVQFGINIPLYGGRIGSYGQ